MSTREIEVDGRTVEVGHPDKALFPDDGPTKSDLADHYLAVADLILPHLEGRPLSLQRFPDGLEAGGFYQKQVPGHFPDWIATAEVEVKGEGRRQRQVVCDDAATLVYLVDQAVVTPHPWLARAADLDRPDRLVFDLDPPGDDFGPVRDAARALRRALETIGLTPFVMTTGSQGLHVSVPLDGSTGWDETRDLARRVCERAARDEPDRLTVETRKDARKGRLFLDYLRNSYGQTAVPPFAVRPLPGAPVAVTLDWDELGRADLGPQSYTVGNVRRRLAQKDDPWADFRRHAASAGRAAGRLDGD